MNPAVAEWRNALGQFWAATLSQYWNEWTLIQLLAIAVAAVGALIFGPLLEHALEGHAHAIKGNARLLRLVVATLRQSRWIVAVALLFAIRIGFGVARVPHSILAGVLILAFAWLVLSIVTRVIRNRTLSRLVAIGGWIYVAVLVLGVADPLADALDAFAVTIGTIRLSAWLVLRAAVVTTVVIWLALLVSRIIEGRLRSSEDFTESGKVLFPKLIRIGLVCAGAAFALTASGIDLSALTFVSGAIGVGIGFGLQKIVSNFISGIIILLDRSVKPGDNIALGDTFGWIQELRARFVSVVTRDGRKYLIPNEDFITQQVINWSYSDKHSRLDVDFGVAYSSDPHQVTALAIAAAKGVERVTTYREPVCWITAFGGSSIEFKLRFWITDPQNGLTNVRGQVLMALWDSFKAAGITFPLQQQDVSFSTPLEVIRRTPAADV